MYLRRPEEFGAVSLNGPGSEQGIAAKTGTARCGDGLNGWLQSETAPGLSAGRGLEHAAGQRGVGLTLLIAVNW